MNLRILLGMTFFLASLSACSAASDPTPTPEPTATSPPTETLSPTLTSTQTPEPTSTPVQVTDICSPLFDHDLSRITSYISNPFAPQLGSNKETGHHGVDFSYYRKDSVGGPIDGTVVQSMFAGRVAGVGLDRLPYGNMLVIETPFEILPDGLRQLWGMRAGESVYLLYAHMLELPTQNIGDEVACGGMLGLVGNSGFSGNPHLHLETRVGPTGIDLPTMIFYDTRATAEEQAAYTEWRQGETWTKFDPTDLLHFAETWDGGTP